MAMEKFAVIKDTHNKGITALSYNPMKHEILVGFEGKWEFIKAFLTLVEIVAEDIHEWYRLRKPNADVSTSVSCFGIAP